MATQTATFPQQAVSRNNDVWLPAFTLWWREIVRFYRQRSRVVGVIASPLLFWIVIGSGFGTSFRSGAGGQHYLDYFYPGALIMIVLFTSIFTMMSVIEDRKEGFLLSVLVAPVSRSAIVLGKVMGGTTLATIQGLIFLAFAPFVGVHIGFGALLLVAPRHRHAGQLSSAVRRVYHRRGTSQCACAHRRCLPRAQNRCGGDWRVALLDRC